MYVPYNQRDYSKALLSLFLCNVLCSKMSYNRAYMFLLGNNIVWWVYSQYYIKYDWYKLENYYSPVNMKIIVIAVCDKEKPDLNQKIDLSVVPTVNFCSSQNNLYFE